MPCIVADTSPLFYLAALGRLSLLRQLYGLTKQRAAMLKPEALIMHPGPINRGFEIDSGRSVILDQVTNGLAVRMGVLFLCAGSYNTNQQ